MTNTRNLSEERIPRLVKAGRQAICALRDADENIEARALEIEIDWLDDPLNAGPMFEPVRVMTREEYRGEVMDRLAIALDQTIAAQAKTIETLELRNKPFGPWLEGSPLPGAED